MRYLIAAICLAVSSAALAQPQSQPVSAGVELLLDRIEKAAAKLKTLRARVRYKRLQVLQGDEQLRFGNLVFAAGPPAKVKVHFDTIMVDGVQRPQDQQWIFDGKWLVERHDSKKQIYKRQIVPPNPRPNQADPLATGEGPFALPIKAKKDLILKRFNVQLVPNTEKDPKNTFHLRLTPRPLVRSEYDRIELWYRRDETLLPVRGRTRNAGTGDESEFTLLDIPKPLLNTPVDPKEISTAVPIDRGWRIEITPWKDPVLPITRLAPTTQPAASQPTTRPATTRPKIPVPRWLRNRQPPPPPPGAPTR